MTPEQLIAHRVTIEVAHELVGNLATGEQRWKMTIPADEQRDILSSALSSGEKLAAEIARLQEWGPDQQTQRERADLAEENLSAALAQRDQVSEQLAAVEADRDKLSAELTVVRRERAWLLSNIGYDEMQEFRLLAQTDACETVLIDASDALRQRLPENRAQGGIMSAPAGNPIVITGQ